MALTWDEGSALGELDSDFVLPPVFQKQSDYWPTKAAKTEAELQAQVAKYLRTCYPQVIFHHDAHAAVNVHIKTAQAAKARGVCKGWPDLAIMCPRGSYHGLFLELKKPGLRLYKVRNSKPYNEHFEAQLALHERLRAQGYAVVVVQDFADATTVINKYMTADGRYCKEE